MLPLDPQNTVVLAVVATAAIYVVSRFLSQWFRKRSGCGQGCSNCSLENPVASASDSSIISAEQLAQSARRLGKQR